MGRTKFAIFLILLLSAFPSLYVSTVSADSEVHDIAVTNVTAWTFLNWPGYEKSYLTVYTNVTVENQGTTYETFKLVIYANNTAIKTVDVIDLAPKTNTTLTITCNLSPLRMVIFPPPWPWPPYNPLIAHLTIRAEAEAVASEIDTSDNIYVDGTVMVTWWIIDVNGDGNIEGKEVAMLAKAYDSCVGDPRYNSYLDFNQDGKIEGKDFAVIAMFYGAKY